MSLIDYNAKSERMGWLPTAPQLTTNPLDVADMIQASGQEAGDFVASQLKSGALDMSCNDLITLRTFRATSLFGAQTY